MKGCKTCGHEKEDHNRDGNKCKYCGFCKEYIETELPEADENVR